IHKSCRPLVGLARGQWVEIVGTPSRLDHEGQRLLVELEPAGDLWLVPGNPRPLRGSVVQVEEALDLIAGFEFQVLARISGHIDEVVAALRRGLHAQQLKELGRHLAAVGMSPERFPEQNVRVGPGSYFLAELLVQGGGVVYVAVLVERFRNESSLLAQSEDR